MMEVWHNRVDLVLLKRMLQSNEPWARAAATRVLCYWRDRVPEQMLYDVRWFVVEAGKPIQLTLTNADAMPHNIVIARPGSINAVGTAAATMPPPPDPSARAYVPESPMVLQATRLVQRGESETIKFTAPGEPGAYNFLCTFPGDRP
jgi:azurin